MFIFWGRKLVYRKHGYVADFCPICREPRAFKLQRVGSAGHVYNISVGEGRLVGYHRSCLTCRTPVESELSTYASVAKARAALPELMAQTYPNLESAWRDRLALEERVRTALPSLQPEERRELIRDPFIALSTKVERYFASSRVNLRDILMILVAFVVMIIGSVTVGMIEPADSNYGIYFFMALGLAMVVWQIRSTSRRYMVRQIVPALASALAPLKPTREEIDATLSELHKEQLRLASKLPAKALFSRLGEIGKSTAS
ncbi:hypothetical protein [Trinickia sp. EG282A]|uniref:hypothetical protein n=1 Tax=Trinickia sp. EG282A TaxID=3237013 RepID=UPI0034D36204